MTNLDAIRDRLDWAENQPPLHLQELPADAPVNGENLSPFAGGGPVDNSVGKRGTDAQATR
jgi:hypothetical protein